MRNVWVAIGLLALLGGLFFLADGFLYPGGFRLTDASAPQVAQVYSEATYKLAQGIALLVIAIGCAIAAGPRTVPVYAPIDEEEAAQEEEELEQD